MRTVKYNWWKSCLTGIKEYTIGHDVADITAAKEKAIQEIDNHYYERVRWLQEIQHEIKGEKLLDDIVRRLKDKQL